MSCIILLHLNFWFETLSQILLLRQTTFKIETCFSLSIRRRAFWIQNADSIVPIKSVAGMAKQWKLVSQIAILTSYLDGSAVNERIYICKYISLIVVLSFLG